MQRKGVKIYDSHLTFHRIYERECVVPDQKKNPIKYGKESKKNQQKITKM